MDQVVKIVTTLSNTPPELLAMIAAGLPLAAFQQKIKKWLSLQKPWVIQTMTLVVSFLAVGFPYALNWISLNPDFFVGYGATVFMGMTLLYRYIVKPATVGLHDFKDYKQNRDLNKDTQIIQPTPKPTRESSDLLD
jgi:mannose/fructose/N-acetylgalactosamine-specific phosphotransferase system component IIC